MDREIRLPTAQAHNATQFASVECEPIKGSNKSYNAIGDSSSSSGDDHKCSTEKLDPSVEVSLDKSFNQTEQMGCMKNKRYVVYCGLKLVSVYPKVIIPFEI